VISGENLSIEQGLIYMLNGATREALRTVRHDEPSDPYRSPLDDPLAIRCESRWSFHGDAGRGHHGDVRGNAIRAFARLWVSVGGK
jgi:hypothetical protein